MNDEHNTINQQREIWWYDETKTPHQITKVVYCDQYGTPHTIWPCTIELRDVQIVKLSKSGQSADVPYEYHVDTNTLIPNVSLIPGEVYSVKGTVDVYSRPGELEKRIKNCYFFPETIETVDQAPHPFLAVSGNEAYSYGSRVATAYDINDYPLGETYTSDYSQYTKWGVSSDIEKTGRIELQGGWYNERFGYVQNGFIFDENYRTRMIFRRAALSQNIVLSKISGNNINTGDTYESPTIISDGETIKFWPKLHTFVNDQTAVSDWEVYEGIDLSISNFSYDSSALSITKHPSDGSWIIEPFSFSSSSNLITINYGDCSKEFRVVVVPSSMFMLTLGGDNPVSNPLEITGTTSLSIRESTDGGTTWRMWGTDDYANREYSFTSNDTSIISTSGTTLIPNPNKSGQSTTVDVVVEGQDVATLTVEVGTITTYYKAGKMVNGVIDSSTVSIFNATNTVSWVSPVQGDMFGVQFFIDSLGHTAREVYCNGISDPPFYGSMSGGVLGISYLSGNATSITVPIYADSAKTQQLGSITINKV